MSFLFYNEVANERIQEGKPLIIDIQVSRSYTYLDVFFSITSTFTSTTTFTTATLPSMLTLIKDIKLEYNGKLVLYSLTGAAALETLNLNSPQGCSVFRQSFTENTSNNVHTVKTFCNLRIPFVLPLFRGGDMMKTVMRCPATSTLIMTIDVGKITDIYGLTSATATSIDGTVSVAGQYLSNYNSFAPGFFPIIASQRKSLTVQSTAQTLTYDLPSDGLLCGIANSVHLSSDYNKSANLNHNDNTGKVRLYSASYNMMLADIHTARSLYYGTYGPIVPRLSSYAHYYFYSLVNGSITNAWNLINNNDARVEKTYNKLTEVSSLSSPTYIDEDIYIMLLPR